MSRKNSDIKLTKKQLIIFGMGLIIYFFFMKSKSQILNYPNYIYYAPFSIFLVVSLIMKYKSWSVQTSKLPFFKQRFIFISVELIKFSVVIWFIIGMVLIPFNYYNIQIAKKQPLETAYCEITGISTYTQNRTLFFLLNGRTNALYSYNKTMDEIKENAQYKGYYFIAELRQGLLGSYILENWSIQKK